MHVEVILVIEIGGFGPEPMDGRQVDLGHASTAGSNHFASIGFVQPQPTTLSSQTKGQNGHCQDQAGH